MNNIFLLFTNILFLISFMPLFAGSYSTGDITISFQSGSSHYKFGDPVYLTININNESNDTIHIVNIQALFESDIKIEGKNIGKVRYNGPISSGPDVVLAPGQALMKAKNLDYFGNIIDNCIFFRYLEPDQYSATMKITFQTAGNIERVTKTVTASFTVEPQQGKDIHFGSTICQYYKGKSVENLFSLCFDSTGMPDRRVLELIYQIYGHRPDKSLDKMALEKILSYIEQNPDDPLSFGLLSMLSLHLSTYKGKIKDLDRKGLSDIYYSKYRKSDTYLGRFIRYIDTLSIKNH